MQIVTYATPEAFLEVTRPSLEAYEVENSLLLGNTLRQMQGAAYYASRDVYYAAALEDGQVVGTLRFEPPYNPLLSAPMAPPVVEAFARHLLDGPYPPVRGVIGPKAQADHFQITWQGLTGQGTGLVMAQGVYALREVRYRGDAPGSLRPGTLEDLARVARWSQAFHDEAAAHDQGFEAEAFARTRLQNADIFLWETGGEVVSMAAQARPTAHGITVNLVYTPPELRGRGYATACVAALSQRLLDAGYAFCTLFTDLANPTSNHIYQRIGYDYVCDFMLYGFS